MASYDALINLKLSSQGLKDLKRIEGAVDKINKPVRTANTRSRVEEKLAKSTEARRVAMIETRRVGDLIQKGVDKGLKLSKAQNAVDRSSLANQKGEFKVSKAQLKVALDELNIETKQAAIQAKSISNTKEQAKAEAEVAKASERTLTAQQRINAIRLSSSFNRTAGNIAGFMDSQRKGIGPNNLLGLPSAKDLQNRGIQRLIPLNQQSIRGSQSTSKITDFTASSVEKAEFFEKRRNAAIARGIENNNKLIGSERIRNAQLIKNNSFMQKSGKNLMSLANAFGKLGISIDNLLPKTRTASGKMLALPSSEMLDKRVRGSGQSGGFSRRIPRFRLPKPTRGFDMQSALISGAFPLLFGQGPVGALAGGLGGGIGGMFGQMGGFAGGIAATALVQQVQQLIGSLGNLGKAMGPFVQDTNALVDAMGLAGTAEGERIKIIEQLEGKQAAFNAAMQKMRETIGTEATKRLEDFGKKASLVGSEFKIAMLKMQAALLPVINAVDRFLGISKGAEQAKLDRFIENSKNPSVISRREELKALKKQKDSRGKFKDPQRVAELEKELDQIGRIGIALEDQAVSVSQITLEHDKLVKKAQEEKDLKEAIKKLTETGLSEAVAKEVAQRELVGTKIVDELTKVEKKLELERETLKANDASAEQLEVNKRLLDDIVERKEKITKETKDATKAIEEQGEAIKKVKVTKEQIADLLANEMTNAITGLIEGTKTLGDVLASVAKSLGNMLLQAGMSNLFNNLLKVPAPIAGAGGKQGLYNRTGGFKAFQQGGVVNSPTMGLIGEGGESEYVIPASKMAGAMARYSAGARGGAVIPGGSGDPGTVAGSSGNTIVEYTGPTLNFNGDEYVPKSAVPEIIGAAAKRGAMAGKAQAIGSLKNSRSQRASLGL